MTKRVGIVCAVLTVVFWGCDGGSDSAVTNAADSARNDSAQAEGESVASVTRELDIAWIHMSPAAQSEQRAYAGFMNHLAKMNWEWNISEVDSDGSGERMANNIEDAVARGVDAIIVSMADLRASAVALKSANDTRIPVFSIDSQYTPGVVVDITSNNYVMSSKVSSYLVDRLGGTGNVVALTMAEHHGVRKRGNILIENILLENPGITLLEDHNIDYSNFYADSQKTMEDWLIKYGSQIDAVWAGWDEPGMAASEAIKANGFTRDEIFVTGIDGHADAIEAIRRGDPMIATVAQAFEVMGEKCAQLIQSIVVEGKPVADVVQVTTLYVDAPLLTDMNLPEPGEPAYLTADFYE